MENVMSHSDATRSAAALGAATCRDRIEEEIIRGYVRLACTLEQADGIRTITLGHFGALEVRLTENPRDEPLSVPPFWLEIYSHACESVIGRCGCYEFDEAELSTAVDLVAAAYKSQAPLH